MFLLDTDVISGLRRADRSRELTEWISAQRSADLFLSVVTIGEIERGITLQASRNPEFAGALAAWLDHLLDWYGDRILGVDVATARRWGQVSARIGHNSADLLIAATALVHGPTVATRSVRHFERSGAQVLTRSGEFLPAAAGRRPCRLYWPHRSLHPGCGPAANPCGSIANPNRGSSR